MHKECGRKRGNPCAVSNVFAVVASFFIHMELLADTMAQQDLVYHEHMKREGGEREHVDVNLHVFSS